MVNCNGVCLWAWYCPGCCGSMQLETGCCQERCPWGGSPSQLLQCSRPSGEGVAGASCWQQAAGVGADRGPYLGQDPRGLPTSPQEPPQSFRLAGPWLDLSSRAKSLLRVRRSTEAPSGQREHVGDEGGAEVRAKCMWQAGWSALWEECGPAWLTGHQVRRTWRAVAEREASRWAC